MPSFHRVKLKVGFNLTKKNLGHLSYQRKWTTSTLCFEALLCLLCLGTVYKEFLLSISWIRAKWCFARYCSPADWSKSSIGCSGSYLSIGFNKSVQIWKAGPMFFFFQESYYLRSFFICLLLYFITTLHIFWIVLLSELC